MLDVQGKEVLVVEGLQLQEVELALQICLFTADWCPCHTPPVPKWQGLHNIRISYGLL